MMKTPGGGEFDPGYQRKKKRKEDVVVSDYPTASENKRRDSQRFTVVSGSEDPSHVVAM